ncbi:hypothetical protein D5R81_18915 [Parashewanella spongiae]|uniref:CopG family transcriptional regulator n=1 Tax=Parashewanella spongiae TaxID=342950 RepID=A0A3A6TJ88_9GAMM|nr:hypothetical protein [Parashewanella spongiae]MCL1080104.1 hypothetical protein [Parashewanella spongiae]RJY04935.1 hypothetical protein D5R81_18915 [Parashewanella spongiae]
MLDLKKKIQSDKPVLTQNVSADEFINQASHYAMGRAESRCAGNDNVVDINSHRPQFIMLGRVTKSVDEKQSNPFRNATFSLSQSAFEQLTELASENLIAKSRILRILIEQHFYKSKKLRNQLLKSSGLR